VNAITCSVRAVLFVWEGLTMTNEDAIFLMQEYAVNKDPGDQELAIMDDVLMIRNDDFEWRALDPQEPLFSQ
jgi:hypothetical protein